MSIYTGNTGKHLGNPAVVFRPVGSVDPDDRVQAFAAAVNECRNRQIGAQEERILNLLGDEMSVLVSVELSQRIA